MSHWGLGLNLKRESKCFSDILVFQRCLCFTIFVSSWKIIAFRFSILFLSTWCLMEGRSYSLEWFLLSLIHLHTPCTTPTPSALQPGIDSRLLLWITHTPTRYNHVLIPGYYCGYSYTYTHPVQLPHHQRSRNVTQQLICDGMLILHRREKKKKISIMWTSASFCCTKLLKNK